MYCRLLYSYETVLVFSNFLIAQSAKFFQILILLDLASLDEVGHSCFVILKKSLQVPSSLRFLYYCTSAVLQLLSNLLLTEQIILKCEVVFVLFNIVFPVLGKVANMYDLCNHCLLKDQSFSPEVLLPSPLPLRSNLITDSSIPHLCFSSNTIVTSLARAFIISHLNYYVVFLLVVLL